VPGSPGLTVSGVAVVVFAVSLVGMVVDAFTGGGIGWLFGGFFVAACCYVAAQVRWSDLIWAVIVPPLVFAVLVMAHGAYTGGSGSLAEVVGAMNGLLDFGPMLWVGTGAAAAIVAWRRWGSGARSSARP
jgi:xanthine/uracil permease